MAASAESNIESNFESSRVESSHCLRLLTTGGAQSVHKVAVILCRSLSRIRCQQLNSDNMLKVAFGDLTKTIEPTSSTELEVTEGELNNEM